MGAGWVRDEMAGGDSEIRSVVLVIIGPLANTINLHACFENSLGRLGFETAWFGQYTVLGLSWAFGLSWALGLSF